VKSCRYHFRNLKPTHPFGFWADIRYVGVYRVPMGPEKTSKVLKIKKEKPGPEKL